MKHKVLFAFIRVYFPLHLIREQLDNSKWHGQSCRVFPHTPKVRFEVFFWLAFPHKFWTCYTQIHKALLLLCSAGVCEFCSYSTSCSLSSSQVIWATQTSRINQTMLLNSRRKGKVSTIFLQWPSLLARAQRIIPKLFCLFACSSHLLFSLATAQALLSPELAMDPGSHCLAHGPGSLHMMSGCHRTAQLPPDMPAWMRSLEMALPERGEDMSKT